MILYHSHGISLNNTHMTKPDCKKHKDIVEKYDGTLKDLAEDVGNLRYDALNEFLEYFSEKIHRDGEEDKTAGRTKLGEALEDSSKNLSNARKDIGKAWDICGPFMK